MSSQRAMTAVFLLGVAWSSACRHAAPGPATGPVADRADTDARVDASVPDGAAADVSSANARAIDAAVPTASAPAEGCTYTPAAGTARAGGISILGLGEGGGGFDMPDVCPAQACLAGLTIDLPKRDDWSPGVYDVEVATDGGTLRCRHTSAPPPAWRAPAHCAHQRELSFDCVGPQPFFAGPIMVSGTPASVRVSVVRDGLVLADRTLAPSYSNLRWDGWECDPSCASAKAAVPVD